MTRINSDINPALLHRAHLVAELREITMVPGSLKRSLKTRRPDSILSGIPFRFTLNKGHVLFFYNKLGFLKKRFGRLCSEMYARGYNPDTSRIEAFDGFEPMWYGDWESSLDDDALCQARINERINAKPHLYTDRILK